MTKAEAVNWIINLSADIGKVEHQELWHYEQALSEIRDLLEDEDAVEVIRCKDCKHNPEEEWFGCPMVSSHKRGDYDYCSFAERRQDG